MEIWLKQKTRPRMNYECNGKTIKKKKDPKVEKKTVEIKVKLPHVNKKPLAGNRIFVQTPFFHSTFELEQKKYHSAKPLAFLLHFLFRCDQNHYSNLTSKIMKMCEQILKRKIAPQYNSSSLNCKKNTAPNTIKIL